ncbi:hypothetical protein MTBBW1_60035 [Desulfamplus magnetovallimortis]|uniref:Uncharacterized protein n=1 Tax=Desulfamplus magnetovallimortis TaxID=1246637 RepID=A0A1W1HI93_9BACT|nr:hypothetical protein [Desulfamplus magnetovallimortis]SLM32135.1 hypothetical protein MTBBW1_60035 [Desulfamplus magnetovallimortis]
MMHFVGAAVGVVAICCCKITRTRREYEEQIELDNTVTKDFEKKNNQVHAKKIEAEKNGRFTT